MDGDHCALIDSIRQPYKPRTKIARKRFYVPNDEKVVEVFYERHHGNKQNNKLFF